MQQAELRLAQIDFDAREYAQAQTAALALLNQPLADDVRAAALLLVAESAYWARNWDQAAASYSRFVSDFPKRPEAPAAGFALGWAEFRRGRLDAARERWAAFAREAPADPRAGEALLLAAELAAKAGIAPRRGPCSIEWSASTRAPSRPRWPGSTARSSRSMPAVRPMPWPS